jgi:transcriptional regulator of acetoin/glycerol metabolism
MPEENNQYSFENEQYRRTYWHTCSHILAQAMKRLGMSKATFYRHVKAITT